MVNLSFPLVAVAFAALTSETFAGTVRRGDTYVKSADNHIFVVGDSLSDNGNVKSLTQGAHPVNRRAATSDYLWNEVWAYKNKFTLKNNAFVAATLDTEVNSALTGPKDNWPVPGVAQQIDALHFSRQFENCQEQTNNPECILVIFGGSNDFNEELERAIATATATETTPDFSEIAPNIASYIDTTVARALEYGLTKIIVANAFPASLTPFGKLFSPELQQLGAFIEPLISKLTEDVVAKYAAQVNGTDTEIIVWDIFQDAIDFIQTSKLDQTPCLDFSIILQLNEVAECPEPSERMWWDSVHPGSAFHIDMAKSFAKAVESLLPDTDQLIDYDSEFSLDAGAATSVAVLASMWTLAAACALIVTLAH